MNKRIKKKIQKRIAKLTNKNNDQSSENKSRSQWWWLRDSCSSIAFTTVSHHGIYYDSLYPRSIYYGYNRLLERMNKMKINIYKAKWDGEKLVAVNIGYIELDEFNKDKCWEMCNWSCHKKNKPVNLHSKISACCSDVAFYNPELSEYHVPDSFGWFNPVKSLDEVIKHWNDDFYTPSSAKGLYDHLQKTGQTFEEIYMEDN